jgi:hypothetical protein
MFNFDVPLWTGIISIVAISAIAGIDVYTNSLIEDNNLEQCYVKVNGKKVDYVTKFCDNWEVYE